MTFHQLQKIVMNQLSEIKKFAYQTLTCFDDLAKPEIKNIVFEKIWKFVYHYVYKIIAKKPDEELKIKLEKIHKTLNPLFVQTQMSIEINEGEKLGSPKIPNVGELAKIKSLTTQEEDTEIAIKLVTDLGL